MFVFKTFSPPRNPLLRLLLGLTGLALIAVFSVFALAAGAAFLLAMWLRGLWLRHRGGQSPTFSAGNPPTEDIIEGEFTVIDAPRRPISR